MSTVAMTVPDTAKTGPRLGWLRENGMGASILVAALASAFGVVLIEATAYIGTMLKADPYIGGSGMLSVVVAILSVLLIGVALYVAAIVTANTFSAIIAGRTRRIALLRLVGSSAHAQRAQIARQGLVVGVIGALIGLGVGVLVAWGGVKAADVLLVEVPEFSVAQPAIALPAAGVVLTTWVAAWIGSRRVLTVTPLQAIAGATPRAFDEAKPGRQITAWVLLALGAVLLVLGIVAGLVTPAGVIVSFFGGLLSFTGISLAAVRIMPPILRLVGRMLGRSAPAKLAAENALRYPERSSKMTIGVVMGVALVTMFAVALESVKKLMAQASGGTIDPQMSTIIDSFSAVMMVLVAISAVIAAVGLVNLLTIGVVQRVRELGLLRAIGLTGRQVRQMVLLEAVHITVTATATGLVLGVLYGWVAAQSLLGSLRMPPAFDGPAGLILPAVPWVPVVVIMVATAILTLIAAATPTRLATRVVPVEALAAD